MITFRELLREIRRLYLRWYRLNVLHLPAGIVMALEIKAMLEDEPSPR